MAKECPRCRAITYDTALHCDTCGQRLSGYKSLLAWFLIVLAALLAMAGTMYLVR